jgi:hypothetical protein
MDELEPFYADDPGPAYLEVYSHAPVLAIRLSHAEELILRLPRLELVQWAHDVERFLEGALSSLGLYKPPGRAQGFLHLFCLNPELPALDQARTMEQAALRLLELLPQVSRAGQRGRGPAAAARPGAVRSRPRSRGPRRSLQRRRPPVAPAGAHSPGLLPHLEPGTARRGLCRRRGRPRLVDV